MIRRIYRKRYSVRLCMPAYQSWRAHQDVHTTSQLTLQPMKRASFPFASDASCLKLRRPADTLSPRSQSLYFHSDVGPCVGVASCVSPDAKTVKDPFGRKFGLVEPDELEKLLFVPPEAVIFNEKGLCAVFVMLWSWTDERGRSFTKVDFNNFYEKIFQNLRFNLQFANVSHKTRNC